MAKLEFTPVMDFSRFNFLGKRLFDFINGKLETRTGAYVGNAVDNRKIELIDIQARCIIIFSEISLPVIWIEAFTPGISKEITGANLSDGILGFNQKLNSFIIGTNNLVNEVNKSFWYVVFGS